MSDLDEELKNAMEILIKYCKNSECDECVFKYTEYECGIHNPMAWKGTGKLDEI